MVVTRIEMERNGLIGINCGGLWPVNEVFQTFLIIEELIQEDLCLEKCTFDAVELFVNIHGFPFASSCVELYKQANKKTSSKKRRCALNSTHHKYAST